LSAAGDKADFMYSTFADVKMLQFNSFYLAPKNIGMTLSDICQKASWTVILVESLPWPLEHKPHLHMDMGRPPLWGPYGRIIYNIIIIIIILYYKTRHNRQGIKHRKSTSRQGHRKSIKS
jgi:hypothetical protein